MEQGYIAVHRKILENPIVCKDADHFSVWLYLLLNATHTNYDVIFAGEKKTLEKGQLLTGRKSIATKFNISESKVQRILKLFESEQQIEQQTSNKNRLITIVNWTSYQKNERPTEQPVNNNRTTTEQPVNTNNNVNKEKKVDKVNNNNAFFENIWKLYIPNAKNGKNSISDTVKKKLVKVGEEKLVEAINNYKKELEVQTWKNPMNGSTFFNKARYEDYFEENFVMPENKNKKSWEKQKGEILNDKIRELNESIERAREEGSEFIV